MLADVGDRICIRRVRERLEDSGEGLGMCGPRKGLREEDVEGRVVVRALDRDLRLELGCLAGPVRRAPDTENERLT